MQVVEGKNPRTEFPKSVQSTVDLLCRAPEVLFLSAETSTSSAVSRESREVRDALKEFQQVGVERSVLKLSFLWHEEIADVFPHLVAETFAHAAVSAPALVADMTMRAESVAKALKAPYVSVDLLCSRFARGMAPVHVDYGEFLSPGRPELQVSHVKALSFVMPYVGKGTEYLHHPQELVEGPLLEVIKRNNNSVIGIGGELDRCEAAGNFSWVPTTKNSFTFHRNGLSIHRAPSSSEFRLLLAIDACVAQDAMSRPLDATRERVIRNVRLIRGHRSKLR